MAARFLEYGFNLDICYVTERILVMGNFYVNDTLTEVRRFLASRHPQYRIYNLCCEPEFNIEHDLGGVHNYPFNANNPCAMQILVQFCAEAVTYLDESPANVVIIHCKSGMNCSGLLAACLLLHSSQCTSAGRAIEMVNTRRAPVALNALSVPSMVRYVHYYEALLCSPELALRTYRVTHVRIKTVPSVTAELVNCGCVPHISLSVLARSKDEASWYPRRVYNQTDHLSNRKLHRYSSAHDSLMNFSLEGVAVRGDVCLCLFSEGEKVSQVYFHTSYIQNNYLCFDKDRIDIAAEDKLHYTFAKGYRIELVFQQIPDDPALNLIQGGHQSGQRYQKEGYPADAAAFMYSHGDTNMDDYDYDTNA